MSGKPEEGKAFFEEALAALAAGAPLPDGFTAHVDRKVTDADWAALDPYSLESECLDCGEYIELHWEKGATEPPIVCPKCGSKNHGGIGMPAGGYHLAMWDDRLP